MGRPRKTTLAERIEATCAEANAFIDAQADILKNSADGKTIPIESLRHMVLTKGDNCACRVALRLLKS